MQQEFNAKARRRKDARGEGENGSQAKVYRLVARIGRANFFFASWRLCAFALKSSSLTALIRLRRGAAAAGCAFALAAGAQDAAPPAVTTNAPPAESWWNWHMANTDVGQLHPSFPAQYSGPNSLNNHFESAETVAFDVFGGLRLWQGAELHLDGLAWQGFGLSRTFGIEAFPSAEAYKLGAPVGNFTLARAYIRQTINLGGQSQDVANDAFHLPGRQDESRVVVTVGEISLLDIFDNNTYASDPQSQFLNWAFVGNEAWDYPANSLGYITGLAAELYQPQWAARYGFFQEPRVANGLGIDTAYLRAWGMVLELERHFHLASHPGDVRLLAYANRAHMGSYEEAVDSSLRPINLVATRSYRIKYGFCLNLEQEVFKDVGLFARLGWSDGHTEAWAYSDVDDAASMGASLNGELWKRPNDSFGLAGVVSAASRIHQQFLEDGGLGILAGDGALNYGLEKAMETYYNVQIWKNLHASADYQFIIDPAFNRARGPVSVLGARIHWDF
jgi:high affinity Mn2+ porin